jgi:flavin-dependent dehydrogenase
LFVRWEAGSEQQQRQHIGIKCHYRGIRQSPQVELYWNPALNQRLAGGQIVPGSQVTVAAVDTAQPALPWDGFARLGDAVTLIPPLCGDGMAMALRSAELCAPLPSNHGAFQQTALIRYRASNVWNTSSAVLICSLKPIGCSNLVER